MIRNDKKVGVSEPQHEVLTSRSSIIADIAGQGAGKTKVIGLTVGWLVQAFPKAKGFIAANTYDQLSNATLTRVLSEFESVYGMTEYDRSHNPKGHFVYGKKPPRDAGWIKPDYQFKTYNNIMTFWNGATVFLGSLDNYKVHDGKEFAWAQLDETKDTEKNAITDVILGRLRQRGMWVDADGHVYWDEKITNSVAEYREWKSWNPLYIHTSPAEGSVDWMIDLLGIAPYEKEIRESIVADNGLGYFNKTITTTDEATGMSTDTTVIIYSAYHNQDNLPPSYIADKKARMSQSEQLKFIYGYPFGRNGGEYYPAFDRFKHLLPYSVNKEKAIHSTWDFNASPYVTNLLFQVNYVNRFINPATKAKSDTQEPGMVPIEVLRISFFKEYCMPAPENTTEQTAVAFVDDFSESKPDVFGYGDASGHARIEGMGSLTNYKIVESVFRRGLYLAEGWLRARRSNIQVRKRRDFFNKVWRGDVPEVEITIEPSMKNTIRDCEYLLQGKDGGKHKEEEKDANGIKVQKLGHCSDAMEYGVCEVCRSFIEKME